MPFFLRNQGDRERHENAIFCQTADAEMTCNETQLDFPGVLQTIPLQIPSGYIRSKVWALEGVKRGQITTLQKYKLKPSE